MGNSYTKANSKQEPRSIVASCEIQNKQIMTDKSGVFHPGNHEAEMCYGGEADLHRHVTGCKKNPGHKGFIPLNDFNINYLPSRYHNDLMFETIKTLAALTVQVKSEFTSLERPEFIQTLEFHIHVIRTEEVT